MTRNVSTAFGKMRIIGNLGKISFSKVEEQRRAEGNQRVIRRKK